MKKNKVFLKLTVGATYLAFNTPTEQGDFDPTTFEETIKSEVVKSIGTTENSDSAAVFASGKQVATVNDSSSEELAMEVIAFSTLDVAKMRGDRIEVNGAVFSGGSADRPFVALGFPVLFTGGKVRYVWYPKCQLVNNTDDIATKEESFSEQNDTLTFTAYPFNDEGNIKMYVDSDIEGFSQEITEEKFFAKVITTSAEVDALTDELGA